MRARRHFQPSLDSLPMRLAPSPAMASPITNTVAGLGSLPPAIHNPMNPAIPAPNSGSSDSDPAPTFSAVGDYTPPPVASVSC